MAMGRKYHFRVIFGKRGFGTFEWPKNDQDDERYNTDVPTLFHLLSFTDLLC